MALALAHSALGIDHQDFQLCSRLLSSNDAPISPEKASLSQVLMAARQHLQNSFRVPNHYHQERDYLNRVVDAYSMVLSPFRCLPMELIEEIVGHVMESEGGITMTQNNGIWVLSRLCRRWRTVVLARSSFWATICLDSTWKPSHAPVLDIILSRSGRHPIKLIHHLPSCGTARFIHMLSHRLQYVTVNADFAKHRSLLNKIELLSLPQLVSLKMHGLASESLIRTWLPVPWDQLTTYHAYDLTETINHSYLSLMQNVVECRIVDSRHDHDIGTSRSRIINLRKLNTLAVDRVMILDGIHATALESVEIPFALPFLTSLRDLVDRSSSSIRSLTLTGRNMVTELVFPEHVLLLLSSMRALAHLSLVFDNDTHLPTLFLSHLILDDATNILPQLETLHVSTKLSLGRAIKDAAILQDVVRSRQSARLSSFTYELHQSYSSHPGRKQMLDVKILDPFMALRVYRKLQVSVSFK
ncbi:hypothetical protein C8J56DRAFT_911565 [Mycena floridula]|nr:hypothetical protein C8J56DRAFT_911565 [Mycena floridula]